MRWSEIGSLSLIGFLLAACEHGVIVGESWTDSGPNDASTGGAGGSSTGSSGSGGAMSGSGGAGATTGTGGSGAMTGSGGAGGVTTGGGGPGGTSGTGGTSAPDAAGTGGTVPDSGLPPDGGAEIPDGPARARPLACLGYDGTPVASDGTDAGTYAQSVIGKWLLCSPTGWLGTSDEAGVELTSDGHWYQLYATPSGDLERGSGPDKEGTWTYDGVSNLFIIPRVGGWLGFRSTRTKEPRRLRLNNNNGFENRIADYIDAASGDAGAGPVPPPYDGGPVPAGCAMEGTRLNIDSDAALKSALVGSWILCERPSIFNTSDELGIEFVADGTWFKLYATGAGSIVRGGGFDRQGWWRYSDPDSQADAGAASFDLAAFGQDSAIVMHSAFTSSPRKLGFPNPRGSYISASP